MRDLVLASLFLPLSHFLIASTPLRAMAVGWLGEKRYSMGYSLLSIAALAWLVFAYRNAPVHQLWVTPRWLDLVLVPTVVLSSVLTVAGLSTPNPVIVGSGALFGRPEVVRGILRVSRNPFFWGAAVFSIAHVLILGDLAALLAFGSIGFLGIAGSFILDAKKARQHGKAWEAFAAATSNLPFQAIIAGSQRLHLREIGWWRILLGVCLALVAFALRGL